ncbi:MAG: hypothetical protein ABI645_15855 [Pseudomonadota bacterium]
MSSLPESFVPPPRWWLLGPGLLIASIGVLLGLYLIVNLPGSWIGGGTPQIYPGSAMGIAAGYGQADGEKLVITRPDSKNATIVTLITPRVSTQEYGLVAIDIDGIPDDADVTLFWRNDWAPTKMFTRSLAVAGGRVQDAMLAGDSNWLGRVHTVGLIVRGPLPRPLTIHRLALKPASLATVLGQRLLDWFEKERWSGISLFRIVGGRAGMDLPLPMLILVATALAGLVYAALRRWRRWMMSMLTIATIVICGWLTVDLRWQWNLVANAATTWKSFAGKDLSEKRLAGIDAELEKIAIDVRPLLTPDGRVLVIAQDPVAAGRLAYLLLPARVYYDIQSSSLPQPGQFKPGDLMLVHRRAGIRYSPERKELLWDEHFRLSAEVVYARQGTVLARVL